MGILLYITMQMLTSTHMRVCAHTHTHTHNCVAKITG